MNCDYCEERVGCSLRKKLDDGTAAFSCGIDFGRDKSETVIYESRKSRLVARYSLPDDPHLRSYRDWFDEEFNKRLSKFFAKRVKEKSRSIFSLGSSATRHAT